MSRASEDDRGLAGPRDGGSEGRARKYACAETDFLVENKSRANAWISDCVPKAWILEHERPVWVQLQREGQKARMARLQMYKEMPTMPFDLWFEMRRIVESEENGEARSSEELERTERHLKNLFRRLGMSRKARLRKVSTNSEKFRLDDMMDGMLAVTPRRSERPAKAESHGAPGDVNHDNSGNTGHGALTSASAQHGVPRGKVGDN